MQTDEKPRTYDKKLSPQEVTDWIAEQLHCEGERAQIFPIVLKLGRTQAQALCKEVFQFAARDNTSSPSQDLRSLQEIFLHLVETKGQPKKHTWQYAKGIATSIAQQLHETEAGPRVLIQRIVRLLGEENALRYLQETIRIEEGGGMMLQDGSRRRTPGGVFFSVVRGAVPPDLRSKLFLPMKNKSAEKMPKQDALPPRVFQSSLVWKERQTIIEEVEQEKGQATTVKITVIGRPGHIAEQNGCIATMVQTTKVPSLPKGLPIPPQSSTHYMLYIPSKQWKKVTEAIKDEEDVLIVEGYPHLDHEAKHISVFVSNVTTKKLQHAQKQARIQGVEEK